MAPKRKQKPFLLRIDKHVLVGVGHWADDELRSLNGQIEWLLREALRRRGRRVSPPRTPDID